MHHHLTGTCNTDRFVSALSKTIMLTDTQQVHPNGNPLRSRRAYNTIASTHHWNLMHSNGKIKLRLLGSIGSVIEFVMIYSAFDLLVCSFLGFFNQRFVSGLYYRRTRFALFEANERCNPEPKLQLKHEIRIQNLYAS
jgi:hypothetical protein